MSVAGQKLRFDPLPATSGLTRIADIPRPARLVRLVPRTDIGGRGFNHFSRDQTSALHQWRPTVAVAHRRRLFGRRHMPVVTMAMRTVVPRTALAVLWREFNLRQGMKMASQLELRSRAALCIQLAKREPANRVLWIAEAESWSRQSNQNFAARQSKHQAADSNATIVRIADRNSPPV
jgi:hypothetical protein